MIFQLSFTEEAEKHLKLHKKSGQKILLERIDRIFDELRVTPFKGIGKPEPLKYGRIGLWSRKIDQKHRIVYEVIEDEALVEVISAHGHYSDK